VAALQRAPIVAVRPTGEEVEVAQVVQIAPLPAAAVVAQIAPAALPATGSSMPLIALFGILALSGGFALWFVRKGSLVKI